jgi:hypothetical protein
MALHGPIDAGVADDQHRAGAAERLVDGGERAIEECRIGLDAVAQRAAAPGGEPGRVDLALVGAEAAFAQALEHDDGPVERLVDDARRLARAGERADADRRDRSPAQRLARRLGLGDAAGVELDVAASLDAPLAVPVGLAVAQIVERAGRKHGARDYTISCSRSRPTASGCAMV